MNKTKKNVFLYLTVFALVFSMLLPMTVAAAALLDPMGAKGEDVIVNVGRDERSYNLTWHSKDAGAEGVQYYADCVHSGRTYYADAAFLSNLRRGIYVTVSSEPRILSTVSSSFSAHKCVMSVSSALAYAGLQDYRARTGASRMALIMSDKSPRLDISDIAQILRRPEQEIEKYI